MVRAQVRGVWRLLAGVALISVGGLVAERAGLPAAAVALGATGLLAVMALACTVAARRELRPLLVTGGGPVGVAGALAGFAAALVLGTAYFRVAGSFGLPVVRHTDSFVRAGWPVWSAYALVALAPAVFEEIAFRGYAMARLSRELTARDTLLLQAALSAVLHLGVVASPSHFLFGLLLGLLRRRTGSLYPGMAAHAGWNAILVWDELGG